MMWAADREVVIGASEGMVQFRRTKGWLDGNISYNRSEGIGWEVVDWIDLAQESESRLFWTL